MPGHHVDVEVVADLHAALGECPVWDVRTRRLLSVDIVSHLVYDYDPQTRDLKHFDIGQPVGAIAPRAAGGLILAVRDGFAALAPESGTVEMLAEVEADNPFTRMNDGKCDAKGRFFAGTMAVDSRPKACALYRLDPNHTVVKVFGDTTESNGIDWSPDDRLMYFIDTATQRVEVFEYDCVSGNLGDHHPLVEIPARAGMPDGLTVDSEGFIWVALWGGGAVHRYSPDGRLTAVITLPVSQVTSCVFGGPDLMDLYITSAAADLTPDELARQPHAGTIFRCRPGAVGRAVRSYNG